MATSDVAFPNWFRDHLYTPDQAMRRVVTDGTRIGSGLATSEPTTFYAGLWDHVQRHDITGLDIRQGLFLAPHPILVGDALSVPRPDLPGPLGQISEKVADARALRRLAAHMDELERREIVFTSAFLGPVESRMVPDTFLTRRLAPRLAGRNRVTAGYTRYHPVHFPDAASALALDDAGNVTVDVLVVPMSMPSPDGRISAGLANGVGGDVLPKLLASDHATLLIYLNAQMPYTTGPGHTVALEDLRDIADSGRLVVVCEDRELPGVPAGSMGDADVLERAIARHVTDDIEDRLDDTAGRALQVGIGRVSVQVVRSLADGPWTGRGYTEMLDPATYDLLDDGSISGTHMLAADGTRQQMDGLACTFAMGEVGSDFADRLDGDERVVMMPATSLLQPAAFHHGLGINNILAIDLAGNVNATARDHHPYSAVGGLATIMRGLSNGGVAYLCMKSTHRTPDGSTRSSVMPELPPGTPVTLTAPDLLGTRNGGRIMLATEHGIVRLDGRPQDDLIRSLIAVAHPDHRDDLQRRAWQRYRVTAQP